MPALFLLLIIYLIAYIIKIYLLFKYKYLTFSIYYITILLF
jgi:hypothetical protein